MVPSFNMSPFCSVFKILGKLIAKVAKQHVIALGSFRCNSEQHVFSVCALRLLELFCLHFVKCVLYLIIITGNKSWNYNHYQMPWELSCWGYFSESNWRILKIITSGLLFYPLHSKSNIFFTFILYIWFECLLNCN